MSFARTIATLSVEDGEQAKSLLHAIEAQLRAGEAAPWLLAWRLQLMNLRWRAHVQGWLGWQ